MLFQEVPAMLSALSARDWMVVGLGIGVVFVGLISLILICYVLSVICGRSAAQVGAGATEIAQPDTKAKNSVVQPQIENRAELAAVIAVAIAEQCQVAPQGIRIHSIKKLR